MDTQHDFQFVDQRKLHAVASPGWCTTSSIHIQAMVQANAFSHIDELPPMTLQAGLRFHTSENCHPPLFELPVWSVQAAEAAALEMK